jgi:hypothetical protein
LRLAAGVSILGLLTAIGCRESGSPTAPDTVVSATPGDTTPDAPQTGAVFVAGSGAKVGDDDYVLNSAAIAGDTLEVSLSYGGGCETHVVALVVAASFAESFPVQLAANLAHEANGDPCQAWLTVTYVFDLALVRTRYREAYGPGAATVVLQLDGFSGGPLVYEFVA